MTPKSIIIITDLDKKKKVEKIQHFVIHIHIHNLKDAGEHINMSLGYTSHK